MKRDTPIRHPDYNQREYDATGINRRLRRIREDMAISQTEFPERAGINIKTYWQYEAGLAMPPLPKLVLLANEWRFPIEDLLYD